MSVRNHFLLMLFAVLVATGCAPTADDHVPTVSQTEWEALPRGCDELIDRAGDEAIVVSFAERTRNAVVLDTPDGSCVDTREHLTRVLENRERFSLLERVRGVLVSADPSPHPDTPVDLTAQDPSPHPDTSASSDQDADPSPHPDKDDDASGVVIIVVIQIGGGGTHSGSEESSTNPNKPT